MLYSLTLAILLLACGVSTQKCRISEFHINQTVGFDEMEDWALLGDPVNVSSPEECRDACCNQEGCESFDLRYDGLCFLVSCGGHCIFKPMENITSYVVEVIPTFTTKGNETVTADTSPSTASTTIKPEASTSEPRYEEAVLTTSAVSTITVASPPSPPWLETESTAEQVTNAVTPLTEPNMTPFNKALSTNSTSVTPGQEEKDPIDIDVTSPHTTMETAVTPSDFDVLLNSTMLTVFAQTNSVDGAGQTASVSTVAGQLEGAKGSQIDMEEMTAKPPVSEVKPTNKSITPIVPESSTEKPTTSVITESSTANPTTSVITESSTEKPTTSVITESSTENPTTSVITESLTEKPTTSVITESTTEKPTTSVITESSTEKPTTSLITESSTEKPTTSVITESLTENPITPIVTESSTENPITPIVTESLAKPITSVVANSSTEKPITVVLTASSNEKPITSVATERTSDKPVTFTTTKKTTMRSTTRATKTHPPLVSSTKSAVGPINLATKENTTPTSKQFTTTQLFSINHLNHLIHNKDRQPMLIGVLFLCIVLMLVIVFISIKACRKCRRVGRDKKGYHKLKFLFDDQDERYYHH